jgi:hypothetical protein
MPRDLQVGEKRGWNGPTILAPHRFKRGPRWGSVELSPRLSSRQRAGLERWLGAAPAEFLRRLPGVRIAAACMVETFNYDGVHATSFIPQGYLLLGEELFAWAGELGRILFHELCHFLWPRLGKGRELYEAAIMSEVREGVRGEMGFSAAESRESLPGRLTDLRRLTPAARQRWRYYLCESFCDTGAYVLLRRCGYNRSRHSEWTLPEAARRRRVAAWLAAVGLS